MSFLAGRQNRAFSAIESYPQNISIIKCDSRLEALVDIIEQNRIKTVFQPIVSLKTGDVFGYEALSRIVGPSPFEGPAPLFSAADEFKLTGRLEELCRFKAITGAHALGIENNLFLNVSPSALDLPDHISGKTANLALSHFKTKDRIILELTERISMDEYSLFEKAVAHYKKQGFTIAIDDFGSGFAGLNMLLRVEPQIVKIDRYMITDINKSMVKRMLLESVVTFCHKTSARVVAEGIETGEELRLLLDMKVDFGQGYYLGKPQETLAPCNPDAVAMITKRARGQYRGIKQEHNLIGSLNRHLEPLFSHQNVDVAIERFQGNETACNSIPVINDSEAPIGIIHKDKLFYKLGQRFGYSVYTKRPVGYIMEKPLVFEFNTSIEHVALRVLERLDSEIYDAVVVVKNGLYTGIVQIRDILARITEQKINMAVQANPLTNLPGNNIIEEEIEKYIREDKVFFGLYFDLDNFKPFNDHFGFQRGDGVLRFMTSLLREKIFTCDPEGFVGHIGGDDFVAVCRPPDIDELCKTIIDDFDRGIKAFHGTDAAEKGFYESINRQGQVEKFSLASLSIGVVTNRYRSFDSYAALASVAAEVKHVAKKMPGSSYFIDQRRK